MATKTTVLVPQDPSRVAQAIVAALADGIINAAKVYREYVEAGGDPMELRRHVQIGADLWRTLDDVACERVDVRVLVLSPLVQRAVRLLPVRAQRDIVERGIELLASDGTAIRVPASELTASQARQAIGQEEVRSISAQAAWLKARTPLSAIPKPPPVQFEVVGGKLRVYGPVELSVSDLCKIMAQMG